MIGSASTTSKSNHRVPELRNSSQKAEEEPCNTADTVAWWTHKFVNLGRGAVKLAIVPLSDVCDITL